MFTKAEYLSQRVHLVAWRRCASAEGGAAAGVQAVGRLDQDTTGLLLLSDDGKFIHRMTSPRHHVPKVYEAQVKHPLDCAAGQPSAGRAWCWTTIPSR